MKNLLFILLSAISMNTFAQNEQFIAINNNSPCDVHATLYGWANTTTGDDCFDLIGSSVTVASGHSIRWDADLFNISPGWAVATYPVSNSTPDFLWASIHFTFSGCPSGCTPAGGNMGDATIGCTGTSSSYTGTCVTGTITGSWTYYSSPYPPVVQIFFN